MPNVLILSMYYWPEQSGNAPYSTGLAEHLASTHDSVTVVTGLPHYPEWRRRTEYQRWGQVEMRNGVRVHRRPHYIPHRQSGLRRAIYEATFLATSAACTPSARPDVVLGVVPSLAGGVAARLHAARFRSAYGLVIQDLVGSAAAQSGIDGGEALAGLTRRIERFALARAAVVAPVTDAFVPYLHAYGVPDARIAIMRNWTHISEPKRSRDETRQRMGWRPDESIVLHAGNIGLKQGLDQVVDAARRADAMATPVRFVLMGDGSQRPAIEASASGVARLTVRPFVELDELPEVLGAADVLLISERESVIDMSMPSKLTSYFAAGRPVVAAVHPGGTTAQEVRRAGAGIVTPVHDADRLLETVLTLWRNPADGEHLGAMGRAYARKSLGRNQVMARADEIIAAIARATVRMRDRA